MSREIQCPVCGQQAAGRKAAKRVQKWLDDSRLDRFMFERLMTLVKAQYSGGPSQQAPGPSTSMDRDKLLQQQLAGGTFKWNALDPDPEPADPQPAVPPETPEARRLAAKRENNRRWLERHPGYSRDYYQRKKAERALYRQPAPAVEEDELGDSALDYAEKQNEKLARDREYQRKYYAQNKERIDRLRKERAARRRSPTTGAKTNGH